MSHQSQDGADDPDPNSVPLGASSAAPATDLPIETMQRLAFVRYLYGTGVEQSRQPEFLAPVAVLSLHDSVELFLQLAAEHTNANPGKRPEFAGYFGVINTQLTPESLSQNSAMLRLNSTRVALKHHGTFPSRLAVEQLRGDVTRFFEDNTPLVFGLDFGDISLVDLVACEAARISLKTASDQLAARQPAEAIISVAVAFAQLVEDYEDRVRARYNRSPFFFGASFAFESSFIRGRGRDPFVSRHQVSFEDKLRDSVVALQDAMKVLALGLDYRRYAKFRLLTPIISRISGGQDHPHFVPNLAGSSTWPSSMENCRSCFDFVIDAAIRLQDFDLDEP